MGFFSTILVGIIAGWLAEKIMKVDLSWWKSLLLGLIGSAIGSGVLGAMGMDKPSGIITGSIVAAIVSCLILWIYKKVKTRT
ncbi:MAG: GlsB/YeaQ/YmgE family stress response membrane protein [Acutalibacteraceae bacterium]